MPRFIRYSIDILAIDDPNDPRFSVILAPNHKGLPPAYLLISGLDPLRDEGLLYEKILKESNVPTKLDL